MPEDTKTKELKEEIETKNEEVIKLGPSLTCSKGGHFFAVIGMDMGMQQVRCDRCPIGYYLPHGGVVKDGHIYIKDVLMV